MPIPDAHAVTSTRRVVAAFLDHLDAGDLPGLSALFAPDVEWRLSWPEQALDGPIPWIRARRTPQDVAAHFRTLAEHNAPHGRGTEVERVVVDGEEAVLMGTIRSVMRRTGAAYEARFALHLTVEEGRIVRFHVYEDSLAVAEAWHAPVAASVAGG